MFEFLMGFKEAKEYRRLVSTLANRSRITPELVSKLARRFDADERVVRRDVVMAAVHGKLPKRVPLKPKEIVIPRGACRHVW